LLTQRRADGDRDRRLPKETVDALTEHGLLRLLVPQRFGGLAVDLRTAVDATAEIARADPSAGWVVMILGSADWLVGLFPEQAQCEVYADGPDTAVCAVLTPHATARRVDGGWSLCGRWAPASGCAHAQWAILGFPTLTAGQSEPDGTALALVRADELSVADTWFTVGMRGTGSNTLIGDDLAVPDHRVLRLGPRERGALLPALVSYMIAPYLGIAAEALDYVLGQADRRGISFTNYRRRSDSTAFQLAVAEAATTVDLVRLIAHDSADLVDRHTRAGADIDYRTRAGLRARTGRAVRECRDAVDALVAAQGAAALAESSPLAPLLLDMHTAAAHAVANPATNAELFGRALLGVEPNITDLI
jgi:alkylation response protein AidB-like acyl-CoA dehydrogenase